jgi:hypothetical protein
MGQQEKWKLTNTAASGGGVAALWAHRLEVALGHEWIKNVNVRGPPVDLHIKNVDVRGPPVDLDRGEETDGGGSA